LEDQPVLVRLLLSDDGGTHRKGLGAGVAAVTLGPGAGGAIAAVMGRTSGDAYAVVSAIVSLNWIQAAIASGFKSDSYSASNIGLPVRI
jgi:hypothetical protein